MTTWVNVNAKKYDDFYLMICMSFGQHGALACICIGEGMELVWFDSFWGKVESKESDGKVERYLNMQW